MMEFKDNPIDMRTEQKGHAYMKRALQLSEYGGGRVSPNPYVGAVITARGRIIGEGYHRRFGEAHAEVNAVASVKEEDRPLLGESTMYVTLEPCSHFGKTPPCADLVVCSRIPHVVVATVDPFLKDRESGIDKMRKAGVKVEVGLMGREARWINRRFFTAHTLHRPHVMLKWAESADGFIARKGGEPVVLSSPFTKMLMHRERSKTDAILVGTGTMLADRPRLTVRHWPSRKAEGRPLKATFRSQRLHGTDPEWVMKDHEETLGEFMHRLYSQHQITSLIVEGGRATLESFISEGLYDEIRVESSPIVLGAGVAAPDIAQLHLSPYAVETYGANMIKWFAAVGKESHDNIC